MNKLLIVSLTLTVLGLTACKASVKEADIDTGPSPLIYEGKTSPEAELFVA